MWECLTNSRSALLPAMNRSCSGCSEGVYHRHLVLLLVGGALTGLVVPYINSKWLTRETKLYFDNRGPFGGIFVVFALGVNRWCKKYPTKNGRDTSRFFWKVVVKEYDPHNEIVVV